MNGELTETTSINFQNIFSIIIIVMLGILIIVTYTKDDKPVVTVNTTPTFNPTITPNITLNPSFNNTNTFGNMTITPSSLTIITSNLTIVYCNYTNSSHYYIGITEGTGISETVG